MSAPQTRHTKWTRRTQKPTAAMAALRSFWGRVSTGTEARTAAGRGWGVRSVGTLGNLGRWWTALCLHLGSSYTTLCTCQNSEICTLWMVNFALFNLYLNKPDPLPPKSGVKEEREIRLGTYNRARNKAQKTFLDSGCKEGPQIGI